MAISDDVLLYFFLIAIVFTFWHFLTDGKP